MRKLTKGFMHDNAINASETLKWVWTICFLYTVHIALLFYNLMSNDDEKNN